MVVLLPLGVGMAILRASVSVANSVQPIVRKVTGVATLAVAVLCLIVYGKGLLGVPGSLAVAAQCIFFAIVTVAPYLLGFGLPHGQKIVLSAGLATRNLGAALAPLFSVAEMDQRAIVMVVLGLPLMVVFAMLAGKLFGPGSTVVPTPQPGGNRRV
jgi:BASS family bile acid:Na+ symporter